TIQQREYVEKGDKEGTERTYDVLTLNDDAIKEETKMEMVGNEKSKLLPTDVGIVVNDFLTEYFPNIMDYNFTANVEKQFDEVAEGNTQWASMMKDFYAKFHPSVESTLAIKTEHKVGERILGEDPATGKPISVKIGRFGPVVQIGLADDEEKPKFAQMKKGMSMETITLEEALELFKLPRTLGDFEEKTVTIGTGRFGPYINHNSKFVSLSKTVDPMKITLEEAVELIEAKRVAEAQKLIKSFEEEPELEILNGRFGPYIAYKKKNYKIPKDVVPQDLPLSACLEIVRLQDEKPASPKRGRFAAKKK
ncbi:MAG: topoisomerase C-terminal repeat-containing protein, partial [Bacteroides sp.]